MAKRAQEIINLRLAIIFLPLFTAFPITPAPSQNPGAPSLYQVVSKRNCVLAATKVVW